ncbi:MAG: hypothetical protein HYZ95_03320 [Candidatus Omnitrophica bacterium]|nr:hypothetical protein [Candidatus Omnitrophota bacterium]
MAKRPVLIVLAFLLTGAILFGGEELVRAALQEGLSRSLQVPVSIRRISFSPRQVTLHGISLASTGSAGAAPVGIQRLRIEGSPLATLGRWLSRRAWKEGTQETLTVTGLTLSAGGVPLHAGGRLTATAEPGRPAWCEGWLTLEHPLVRGEIEVSGRAKEPVIYGWLGGPGLGRRHFIGQFLVGKEGVALRKMDIQGGWRAEGAVSAPEGSAWQAELKVAGPDRRYELQVAPVTNRRMQAVLWMRREGEPPEKVSAVWSIQRSRLEMEARILGEEATLGGQVDLRPPHALDLKMDFRQLDVGELLGWYLPGVVGSRVSGRVQGQVSLTGSAQRPVSVGELFGTEGSFGQLRFDAIALRFQGQGPLLRIHDSQIVKPRGVVSMEGTVDLRRIGQQDFFQHVKLNSSETGVEVLGLEMTAAPGGSGVRLGRAAGEREPKIGLTVRVDDAVPQEPLTRQELDVEYPISAQERVNFRVHGEEEVLSVEHRRKF